MSVEQMQVETSSTKMPEIERMPIEGKIPIHTVHQQPQLSVQVIQKMHEQHTRSSASNCRSFICS